MAGRFVLIFVLTMTAIGCRAHSRTESVKRTPPPAVPTRDDSLAVNVPPPTPPTPPPLPVVSPPKPDALATNVPPLPIGGESMIAIAAAEDPTPTDPAHRERLDDWRKNRDEPRPVPPAPTAAPAAPSAPPKNATPDSLIAVRALLSAAEARFATVVSYDAVLTKREVVNGKQMPMEEAIYRVRKEPLSVAMTVIGEAGKGREVMYVRGQYGNKMHVMTGKGDNAIMPAGYRTDVDPESKLVTTKSRYKVYEAGFGRTLNSLTKALAATERKEPGYAIRSLGAIERKEVGGVLDGIEVTLPAGAEPQLPKGGKRQVYFDSRPESPGYRLPIVTVTTEPDGKEVEYYWLDKVRVPGAWVDADWTPTRLGK